MSVNSEIVRDKILREFYKLFCEKGFAQTTLRELGEKSGMSKGHIGFYFNRKEELMIAIAEKSYKATYSAISEACKDINDQLLLNMLHHLFLHYLGFVREITYRFTAEMWENHAYLDWMTRITCDHMSLPLQSLGVLMEKNQMLEACAFSTYGIYGIVSRSYSSGKTYDYESCFRIFMTTFFVQIGFCEIDEYINRAIDCFRTLDKGYILKKCGLVD